MMMNNNQEQLSFYRKMAELQEKLRKSEDERAGLEAKFHVLVKQSRAADEARLAALRQKYNRFIEEEKRRRIRNEKIMTALDKIEKHTAVLNAKTERLKLLRRHFDAYMARTYPDWKDRIKKSTEITDGNQQYEQQQPTPGFTLTYPKQEPYTPKYIPSPKQPAINLTKESDHFKSLMKEKYKIKSPQYEPDYSSYGQKTTALRQGDIENIRRSFHDLATPFSDSMLEQQTDFNTSRDLLSVTFDDDPVSDNKENKVPVNVSYKNDTNIPKLNLESETKVLKTDTSEDEDAIIKKLTKISSFDEEKEDDFDPSVRPGTSMGNFRDEPPEPLHSLVPQTLGYHRNDLFQPQAHNLNFIHDEEENFGTTLPSQEEIVEEHIPAETVQEFTILPGEQKQSDNLGDNTEKGIQEINEFDDFSRDNSQNIQEKLPEDSAYSEAENSEAAAISFAKSDTEYAAFDEDIKQSEPREPQQYYNNQYDDNNGTILEEDEEISREMYEDEATDKRVYQPQGDQNYQQDVNYTEHQKQPSQEYSQNSQFQDQNYRQGDEVRGQYEGQNYPPQQFDPQQGQYDDTNYVPPQEQDPNYHPQYQDQNYPPQEQFVQNQEPLPDQVYQDQNYPQEQYRQDEIPRQDQQYGENQEQYAQDANYTPEQYSQDQMNAPRQGQGYGDNQEQYAQDANYTPEQYSQDQMPRQDRSDNQDQYSQEQYSQDPINTQRQDIPYSENQDQNYTQEQYSQDEMNSQRQEQSYGENQNENYQRSQYEEVPREQYAPQDPNYAQDPNYQPQDPNYQPQDPNYQPQDPNYQPQDPNYQHQDPNYQPQDPNYGQDPNYQPQDPNYQPQDPNYQPQDPNYQPQDPNYQPQDTMPANEPDNQSYAAEVPQDSYQADQHSTPPEPVPVKSNEGFREMELNMPDRGDTDTLAELDSSDLTTTSDMKPVEAGNTEPVSAATSSTDEIEKQMAALVTTQQPPPAQEPPPTVTKAPQSSPSSKSSPNTSRPSTKTPSRPSSGSARSKPPSPAAKKSPTTRSPASKKP